MTNHPSLSSADVVRVLVGPEQREFVVHRKLLCASSAFFRDNINSASNGPASSSPPKEPLVIWLAGESAGVFELFVLWLYRRHAFRSVIDEAMTILVAEFAEDNHDVFLCPLDVAYADAGDATDVSEADRACTDMHWNLVDLHIFAAIIDLPALQDAAMDALQDLYLRFDWEATPDLVRFLYTDCDPIAAYRLRKWAVALLAWTLSNRNAVGHGGSIHNHNDDRELLSLLSEMPQLLIDYDAHLSKMLVSRADVRIKNPQLRIPSNHLRRDDRHFGFRQCSFHSHRRAVGENRCPHSLPAQNTPKTVAIPGAVAAPHRRHVVSPSVASPALSTSLSSQSSNESEPWRKDLRLWSARSTSTPGIAPLNIESTV